MQSRWISRLARKLRSTHRKTKSWSLTARQHGIVTDDGQPNKGLAYRIAMQEYEPRGHATLIRIGAPCACDECKRNKIRTPKKRKFIDDMTEQELIQALHDRRDMGPVDPRIVREFKRLGWLRRPVKGQAS